MVSKLPLYLNIVAQNKKTLLKKSKEEYQKIGGKGVSNKLVHDIQLSTISIIHFNYLIFDNTKFLISKYWIKKFDITI